MPSSNFTPAIASEVHALYDCEGDVVTVQFMVGPEKAGDPFTFSCAEAVKFGETVMQTGLWDKFPISGVPLSSVKDFAQRLRDYGRDGR